MSKVTMLNELLKDYSYYHQNLKQRVESLMESLTPPPHKPVTLSYKSRTFKSKPRAVIPITSIVESYRLTELYDLCDTLLAEEANLDYVHWYLTRLLSEADSIETIQKCLPEYLHPKIERIAFNGDKGYEDLFIQKCYDSLEQAILMNTLLRGSKSHEASNL